MKVALDRDLINRIESLLPEYITSERYQHTLGVKQEAIKLSRLYKGNSFKAECASLLHDVARDLPLEVMQSILKEEEEYYKSELEPGVINDPLLLHPLVGAIIARKRFGVQDREILKSIELHTTGDSSMSTLDKIVFVADYIEPGRNFRGVKEARKLACKNLDMAVIYIFKSVLKHLLTERRYICIKTISGYNDLILKNIDNRKYFFSEK